MLKSIKSFSTKRLNEKKKNRKRCRSEEKEPGRAEGEDRESKDKMMRQVCSDREEVKTMDERQKQSAKGLTKFKSGKCYLLRV